MPKNTSKRICHDIAEEIGITRTSVRWILMRAIQKSFSGLLKMGISPRDAALGLITELRIYNEVDYRAFCRYLGKENIDIIKQDYLENGVDGDNMYMHINIDTKYKRV